MNENNFEVITAKKFTSESYSNFMELEVACSEVLQSYITEFYNKYKRKWFTDNLTYSTLGADDANFLDYTIILNVTETDRIKLINKLIKNNKIYSENCDELSVFFDRHLCQPLIIDDKPKLKSTPPGLNNTEKQFVEDLKNYLEKHQTKNKNKRKCKVLLKFMDFRRNSIDFRGKSLKNNKK